MRAMVLERHKQPLALKDIPIPKPEEGQLLIKVHACGICRTDLHVIDGELPNSKLPIVPGHQIVGTVEELGAKTQGFQKGERIGIPWLQGSDETCPFCLSGRENLCDHAVYTGFQVNGGFAEYCIANSAYCFPLPPSYPDFQVAPLLCAGLIGYRSLRFTENAHKIGFYGFGASAHILSQVIRYQGRKFYAFTRTQDSPSQKLARELGATWVGNSDESPPELLDAAIIFAPEGPLVPKALKALNKGGIVVCAGIHMSDIPSFPYSLLWEERVIRSVANLTRQDGYEFLELAPKIPIETKVTVYPLEQVNQALEDLRHGRFSGAAVIDISP